MSSRALSSSVFRATLALAVGAALSLGYQLGILSGAQVAASDRLFKTHAAQPARSTVIVGIDQRSYRALLPAHGPLSQWPRTLYARALDSLRGTGQDGPRVVAFEVFFDGARPEDEE